MGLELNNRHFRSPSMRHLDDIKGCHIFSQASMSKCDTDAELLSVSVSGQGTRGPIIPYEMTIRSNSGYR